MNINKTKQNKSSLSSFDQEKILREKREKECMEEIKKVLEKYNCTALPNQEAIGILLKGFEIISEGMNILSKSIDIKSR